MVVTTGDVVVVAVGKLTEKLEAALLRLFEIEQIAKLIVMITLIDTSETKNREKAPDETPVVGVGNSLAASIIQIEIEQSALERVPTPNQVGEHVG